MDDYTDIEKELISLRYDYEELDSKRTLCLEEIDRLRELLKEARKDKEFLFSTIEKMQLYEKERIKEIELLRKQISELLLEINKLINKH